MTFRLGSLDVRLSRYLGLWAIVVVVFAMQGCVDDAIRADAWPVSTYLRWSAIQWLTWAGLAPLVFRLGERHPIPYPPALSALGRHIGYSVAVTALAMVIGALVSSLFEPSGFGEQLVQFVSKHFATGLLAYWALLAVQQLLYFQAEKSRREVEAAQLATELAQSRLQVLKTQLQPHFLFNTLHAIITLLDEDTVSAEDMLLRLSELLRAFLEDYDGQEIPLRQELDLIELYLGIQRIRFKDRLTTRTYIAPDTLDCAVPSLLLQPLVENAVRHGIGQRVGSDVIEIETRRDGDVLCIEVRNRNSTLDATPGAPAGHGIGMSNTRLRLKELYGDAADVRLDMTWPEGVACRVRLPFRELGALDDEPEFQAGAAPA